MQLIRSRYPSKENRLFDDVLGTYYIMAELLYNVQTPLLSNLTCIFPSFQQLSFFTIQSMAMLFYFPLFHLLLTAHLNMTEVVHHLLLSFPCFAQTTRYYETTDLLLVYSQIFAWISFYVLLYLVHSFFSISSYFCG